MDWERDTIVVVSIESRPVAGLRGETAAFGVRLTEEGCLLGNLIGIGEGPPSAGKALGFCIGWLGKKYFGFYF